MTLDALHRLSVALETETLADKLADLDRQIADLTKKTGGTPGPLPKYDNLTEDKGERLLKAREARLGLLKKKVAEQEGAEEDKRRRKKEGNLAALEEQQRGGQPTSSRMETRFEEDEDDEEEAAAQAVMEAYLAEREKAKGGQADS